MKGPSGLATFGKLKRLAHVLLILPYDQAPVERVFSMVNKSDTKFRPSLGNTTVCALLVSKINSGVPCPQGPQLNVSEQLFRDVKAAASKRNNDLRVAREEAAANNDVAVESEDESDDE